MSVNAQVIIFTIVVFIIAALVTSHFICKDDPFEEEEDEFGQSKY